MRKIYSTLKSVVAGALVAAMTFAVSCSYDDTAMKNRVDKIESDLATLTERVDALEDELDNQVAGLKELINGKVVVTGVETEGDVTTVTLSDGSSFVIDNSKGGATAGGDYTLGAQEDGGVYYWAVFVNGTFQEYLLVDGNKVPVFAEATESGESCACELQMEVREDGKLYVSIDGGANWVSTELPASQVSGACVFASVEVDGDNVIFTLTDGTTFNVQKAELVEFEAAKSAVYVKVAETVAIPFAINDAVEDINVMNTPLGWKAEVVDTRAVGGMDFALNITGPAKEFMQYADKSGKVAIHFNTAAGACKVMSVDVELATIDLQVDQAGNITIVNTLVDKYDKENWGVTEHIEEFNNYYFAVLNIDDYYEYEGRLEEAYNSNWGEFNITAAASYIQNFFTNVGENDGNSAIYQDGVNEKWTVSFTVEEAIDYLDWYDYMTYEGNSFMICVIPTDVHNNGDLLWDEMVAVPFKQLAIKIEEIVEARAFDNAYFNVTLRGGVAYHLYPMSMKDVTDYVEVYEYYPSKEDLFWDYLNSYLQYPNWYSFGFEIAEDVVEENISLSDLLAYTHDYYSFETKPATEYVMALFVWEDGKTEYTKEDLKFFEFSTAELTVAEPALEYTWVHSEDYGLYTVSVDLTVAESVSTLYTRWYDSEMGQSDLLDDLINNGYSRDAADLEANQHTVYVGTSVSNPATTKYLGVLMIDAEGNYTATQFPVTSKDIVMNDADFSIESVEFTPEAVTVTLAGLENLEVKAYKYYFISTTGGSNYQKTEEQCQDIAYSNDWLYKSTEAHPIIITSTADYKSSFSDGTYKLAVGVEFADGSFSKCVYGEYTYEQPAEELVSVSAVYQESDPNWYAVNLTKANGDVINTLFGNGGVNYLEEGLWDFNRYYSDGFALGNTYVNGTTWVGNITVLVAYVDGKYDLTVNSSVGKYHYYGDIEGLVVPGYEGGEDPEEPEQPAEPEVVEFTSVAVAAVDSNLNYHNLTFTDGTYTAVIKLCTRGTTEYVAGLYDQNGSFGDASTLYIGGYATDNTWNGAECWPVTMEVVDNGDGTATFNLAYSEYPSAVAHKGTYTGVLEGLTLVEREEPEQPEVPGDVTELSIVSHGLGYTGSMETEVIFTDVNKNQHLVDFRMTGIEAGTYNSDDNGIILGYCRYMYGSSEFGGGVVFDSANGTITDNGNTTFTFDVNFVADGAAYHFTYTTPAEAVEESGNTVELVSKSAGEEIGSYYYGWTLADAEGNNSVKLVIDQAALVQATDFPKAHDYTAFQSSPTNILNGNHFSFVNKTLKVNGETYANADVTNAKLTVVEATSITIEFTVGGEDYKFVYNAF